MSKKNILGKIKSDYILQKIMNYINIENFTLKLFTYSKFYQKKLKIKLSDYQEKYLNKIGLKIEDYFSCYDNKDDDDHYPDDYDKEILIKEFSKFKIDPKDIKNILVDYGEKYYQNMKEKYNDEDIFTSKSTELTIDIFSPFFECLSQTEIFGKIFCIPISVYTIKNLNLNNDFKSCFDKLNKSKSKYSSIIFDFRDSTDINYLKTFKINLKQIKKIFLHLEEKTKLDKFFKSLYSFIDILNNLEFLHINIRQYSLDHSQVDNNLMNNINNFKSLKQIVLVGFNFKKEFILNIPSLKGVKLLLCDNIGLDEQMCLNLKKISLSGCELVRSKKLLKFPNVEICELEIWDVVLNEPNPRLYSIIDFQSFKNLKFFEGEACYFIKFKKTLLESAQISVSINNSLNSEKIMINNLISIQTLIDLTFQIGKMNNDVISKIKGENKSVRDLTIVWINKNDDCKLNNLLKKFPNITDLQVIINSRGSSEKEEANLIIEDNPDCKINKLTILYYKNINIKLYCQKFENLNYINLYLGEKITNLKNSFPLFNSNCNAIFKNLTSFSLKSEYYYPIDSNVLINLYRNLEKIPNLKYFYLDCLTNSIQVGFSKKFLTKILSLKLISIYFLIKTNIKHNDKPFIQNRNKKKDPY